MSAIGVSLAPTFFEDLASDIDRVLAQPLVSLGAVRRLAGRTAWAVGLVPAMRSFTDALWSVSAELAERARRGDQRGKFLGGGREPAAGTSRIRLALLWVRAFLRRKVGDQKLGRTVDARVWANGPNARITSDASPWGLGAVLEVDGQVETYLWDDVTAEDVQVLGVVPGSCRSQATLEVLALAVAMRAWLPRWAGARATVTVRSDSVAAVGAFLKGGSAKPSINRIVRAVALDIASSRYGVDFAKHLPGKANLLADSLSRLSEPGRAARLPPELANVPRTPTANRGQQWWEASAPPGADEGHECAGDGESPESSKPAGPSLSAAAAPGHEAMEAPRGGPWQ